MEQNKRTRVSQSDVPAHSLSEALKVAEVLKEQFAKQPTKPLMVAKALDIKPTSSRFRMLTGAAVAYGLTTGGYNAQEIGLTDLGKRCVSPVDVGDDELAKRTALIQPRVISEFLRKYNNNQFPTDRIGVNVLEEMGIAQDRASKVLAMIKSSAKFFGLTKEIKGTMFVDLDHPIHISPGEDVLAEDLDLGRHEDEDADFQDIEGLPEEGLMQTLSTSVVKKVFITHGKDTAIVDQLKELLLYGKFDPVVSVEHQTGAKPVPQKVMDDMRSCEAAVIHVGSEKKLTDTDGNEVRLLNQNVLIEIGAAMALYGHKFVLLVEEGVELPSNLQGLYEVRYSGEKLELDAAMKLLKSFNEFTSTADMPNAG